jgi:hypothetical protein
LNDVSFWLPTLIAFSQTKSDKHTPGYFRDLKVSALAPVFQAVQRRPTIPWNQKRQFQKKATFGFILPIPSTKLPYGTKEL